MDKNNLIKIINKELTIVNDLLDGFSQSNEIHPFEIDLALSKVKDIYGELLLLKRSKKNIAEELNKQFDDKNKEKSPRQIEPIFEVREEQPQKVEAVTEMEQEPEVSKTSKKPTIEEDQAIDNQPVTETRGAVEEVIDESIVTGKEPENEAQEKATIEAKIETEIIEEDIDEAESNVDVEAATEIKEEPIFEEEKAEVDEEIITEEVESELVENEEIEAKTEIETVNIIEDDVSDKEVASAENKIEQEVKETPAVTDEEVIVSSDNKTSNEIETSKGSIIADKFNNQSTSLNDMLAGVKKNKDLASSIKDRPISDLKAAIKINDRIWYINELFNKNASAYEAALEKINQSENLDKALEFLFTTYNWDQNKKSTVSFLELVFRRFTN